MTRRIIMALCAAALVLSVGAEVKAPAPYGAVPSKYQLEWQNTNFYAFVHFSMNTFHDLEWGYGDASPDDFYPTNLDCEQWVKALKAAGMRGVIITAKHHDGFCLWPTKMSDYSVKSSKWRDGKGDVVGELSRACKKYGIKFGVYLSPWDRHNAHYGTPEYIDVYRGEARELLSWYGPVFEFWQDGANGGDGYYGGKKETRTVDRKTYYDWETTNKIIHTVQPGVTVFSDAGPDARWCGTEAGWVGKTNWSMLTRKNYWPGYPNNQELLVGEENGTDWVPAEVDVSIRPGWYYHASQDNQVKSVAKLLDIYYNSIGRNGNLILNVPADPAGLIHPVDEQRLADLGRALQREFQDCKNSAIKQVTATNVRGRSPLYGTAKLTDMNNGTYWATDDDVKTASVVFTFAKPTTFNRFFVREYIALGQRVKAFTLEAQDAKGQWTTLANETTIGNKRILRLPETTATAVRFSITDSRACPIISDVRFYLAPQPVPSPVVKRDKNGLVTLSSSVKNASYYYTTDGTQPTLTSTRYTGPVKVGKCTFTAMTCDERTGATSDIISEMFEISREAWTVKGVMDTDCLAAFDGEDSTTWFSSVNGNGLAPVVIDLGASYDVRGFGYLPDQGRPAKGLIDQYELYVSTDGNQWALASSGEFSNIKNNPDWQYKTFTATTARYLKFVPKRIIGSDTTVAGITEFTVLTQ